jgi:serine protease Do
MEVREPQLGLRCVRAAWRRSALVSTLAISGCVGPPAFAAPRTGPLAAFSAELEALAARVAPSVVQIFTTSVAPAAGTVASAGELVTLERGSGSGVIVDAEGYVVTNAHVVKGARRLQVELPILAEPSGSILRLRGRLVGAQLVGLDDETDLAVLKIEERGLRPLAFGDSESLHAGQVVLAFGSPLGLQNSVSLGVVSAVARQFAPEAPMIYIQTDAPINPGSSGGALVDVSGGLMGINTLILSQGGGHEGLGFAAPSHIVSHVSDQIRRHGRVRRGTIGVHAQTLDATLADGLQLARGEGVVVSDVTPGGPAAQAGLQIGDVVRRLDGKPMENGRQFQVNLYRKAVGESVRLEVEREGRAISLSVTVAERPGDTSRLAALVDPERNVVARLGILALSLDERLAALVGARGRAGVIVASVSGEIADPRFGGFQPGDVIYAVNRRSVLDLDSLHAALQPLRYGDSIVVQVERGGRLQYLAFTAQ